MAAGQGYIEFATGDVLTAAAANGYLASQVVMVFASSAARTSAIASPQEGMLSYLKDTNAVEAYDGAAWVSVGSTGDITGVTAGTGISGGGTSGTVTVTNSMATAIDAKGDLIGGTGADTFSRLAVGANGTVLTADSAEATGLKWATAGGSGGSTLIETQSFSAVSAVNFTSKLSSTYDNYSIIFDYTSTAADDDCLIRLRSGSTDNSNTTYNRQLLIVQGSTVSAARATAQNALTGVMCNSTGRSLGELFLYAPNLAQTTSFIVSNNFPASTISGRYIWGNFTANTQFDGISFIPASGTITGKMSLYGLAK